jgi:hypothetical protein
MSLPFKKAKEEYEHAVAQLRDALVSVARMRLNRDIEQGNIPSVVTEATYLLNEGRHDMMRVLLDFHDECVEAAVNLDIAWQSSFHEHGIDPEGTPDYLAEESAEPPIRILERDYERVVEGDPADLGSGIDPVIIRLARLDPDEV